MRRTILWLVCILVKFHSLVIGCDYASLESDADGFNRLIWSSENKTIGIDTIKESLNFLEDANELDNRYRIHDFLALYQSIEKIEDEAFRNFAKNCSRIYNDSGANETTKVAVYLLLSKVHEKFRHELSIYQNIKQLKKKH